jgi:hypothetical protein
MTDDGHYFAVKKPAWLTTTKKRRRCAQKGRKRKPYRHHGALEVARRPAVRLSHTHILAAKERRKTKAACIVVIVKYEEEEEEEEEAHIRAIPLRQLKL